MSGANRALVASDQAPTGLGGSRFDHGYGQCPYGANQFGKATAWHEGFRAGCDAANAVWNRAFESATQSNGEAA